MTDRYERRALPVIGVPECTDCGSCCFNAHPAYIRIFERDAELIGAQLESYSVMLDGKRYMRFENGRCVALRLDSATGSVGCSIYAIRPDVCRSLERGSGECRSQLEMKWSRREAAFVALTASSADA